ncbi:uncharacterized protein RJT20DRAFT_30006 [Scheffersomyces xylosifermentans]|uniref:uncharacterized protein n=1 Tax=Scheffersomyces xylosifermentans TaxID=1304137 RepID=UPI00315C87EA
MFLVSKAANRVQKLYYFYYFNTPLPILSYGEAFFFILFNLCLLLIGLYYFVYILPCLIVHAMERVYFYLTGNVVSLNLFVTSILQQCQRQVGSALNLTEIRDQFHTSMITPHVPFGLYRI